MSTLTNRADYVQYGIPVKYLGCYKPDTVPTTGGTDPEGGKGVTVGVQLCLSKDSMRQYAYLGYVPGTTGSGSSSVPASTRVFCGNDSPANKVNDFLCNKACAEEAGVVCGGTDDNNITPNNYFSVYYLNTFANAVAPYQVTKPVELDAAVTSAKVTYAGCFPVGDLTQGPANIDTTSVLTNNSMTIELCVDHCAQLGWESSWVRSGTICTCGSQTKTINFATNPDDACDAACPGYTDGSAPSGTAKCGGKIGAFANNPNQVRVSLYNIAKTTIGTPATVSTRVPDAKLVKYKSPVNQANVEPYYVGCANLLTNSFLKADTTVYSKVKVPYPSLLTVDQCLHACDPAGNGTTWALLHDDIAQAWYNGAAAGRCQCIRTPPASGAIAPAELDESKCSGILPGDRLHTIGKGSYVSIYGQRSDPKTADDFKNVDTGVPVTYAGCFNISETSFPSSSPNQGYLRAVEKCLSMSYIDNVIGIFQDQVGQQSGCIKVLPPAKDKVADSLCNKPCEDDLKVGCGGSGPDPKDNTKTISYASVYSANTFAFSSPPYPIIRPTELNSSIVTATMKYGGCMAMSRAPSDLRTVLNSDSLTQDGCVDLCLQYGFVTAILQNATICGCSLENFTPSMSPVQNPEINCNAPCPGSSANNGSNKPACGSVPVEKVVTDPKRRRGEPEEEVYVPFGSYYGLTFAFAGPRTNKPAPLSSFSYTSFQNNDTLSVTYAGCFPISDPVLQKGPYRPMSLPYPRLMTIEQCIHACDPNGGGATHPVLKQIANVNWPNGANSQCQCITGATANLTATPNESKCFSLLPGDNTHTMGYDDYVSVYTVKGSNNGTVTPPTSSAASSAISASASSASVSASASGSASVSVSASDSVSASVSVSPSSVVPSSVDNSVSSDSSSTSAPGPSTTPDVPVTPSVLAVVSTNGLTFRSQGCWGEPAQQPSPLRALPTRLYPAQRTVQACLGLAASSGFKKAGLEFGGECWASNGQVAGGAIPASFCSTVCADDAAHYCGGPNNLNLYFADGADTGATTLPAHQSGTFRWTYSSCWGEPAQGRALPNKIIDSGATVQQCLDLAASRGYGYAGLEWYGECWAAFSAPLGGQIDESYCNLPCSSDSAHLCGGGGALSYYRLGAQSKAVVSITSNGQQSTWRYQSCYGEPAQGRSMPVPFDNSIGGTLETCLQAGTNAGFINCGLEFGQECWCSNERPFGGVIPESFCNMPCAKDNRELCGSGNVLSFYSRA